MRRIKFFVVVCLTLATMTDAAARIWEAKGGKKVEGEMVDQTADTVSLQIVGRNAPVVVRLEHLTDKDQAYAKRLWFEQQDAQQYSRVVEHLRSIHERPKTVQGLLVKIHNAIPESPYAGLWAAVALSQGANEHTRAAVLLKDVVRRIENQQSIDPSRHRMTFASASNNLAVCLLKDRRGDSAAARMIMAINSRSKIPSVVRHNAQLLNELTTEESFITLSSSTRSRLLESLALGETAGAGTKLNAGWHYSLDFDVPSTSSGSEKEDGIDAPRSELQLLAQGTGFVVAPGVLLTSRRVVETTNYRGPKLVTVVTNPRESDWHGEIADGIIVEATRSYANSGTVVTGNFGSIPTSQAYTNFSYVRSPDGHSGAELAVLRIPNLSVRPLPLSKDSPVENAPISIHGFDRGQNAIRRGLRVEEGEVLKASLINRGVSLAGLTDSSRVLFTSARVLGGNRGGPVVDRNNNVVGIAFSTPAGGSRSKGLIFGASEIRNWFYQHVQTASILDPNVQATPDERREHLLSATIPVLCWGLRSASESQVFSKVSDGSRTGGTIFVRDSWCIACDGKGIVDCPVKRCNNGQVSGRVKKKLGVRFDGSPIYGSVPVSQKCETCRGAGGRKCPHCKNGRL
jgi:S1-C subfamily serine protease